MKKGWIMQKFEQLVKWPWPLWPFCCFPMCRVKHKCNEHFNLTQNFSSLYKYSQNKHHFCQGLHIWSFSAIRWQVFLHLTQFFHQILHEKCGKTSFWSVSVLKLSNQAKQCPNYMQYPGSSRKDTWNVWKLKIIQKGKASFSSLFR